MAVERTSLITKDTPQEELQRAVKLGRAMIVPYNINDYVWIVVNGKPTKTMCMDVGLNSIQLNGRWWTWEEIDNMGGVFDNEFDALRSMS
ncbi:MAG: hypothetical protein K6F00_03795 [Lachnospiraceae bacterium]|nr:hypothetical protein [Lachnospiraceae bacterium]